MNIGEMQRKLSLWAEKDKQHRFFDLYHLLYDKDWLRLAHDYVKQNAGSITAGCDGINMSIFDENLQENLLILAQELKSQTFQPHPVRRVYISKANGKTRSLGIPSIRDRIVQEGLRMILEPIYEADFSRFSFGFRPDRCTADAVKYVVHNTTGTRKYYWIIEADISSYFDTINHRKLMKIVGRRIRDKKILRLIWKFLRAGVMEGKLFKDTKLGTPQGGIISPLFANIYLNELDEYMQYPMTLSRNERVKRRKSGKTNYIHIRYADDFVILCDGRKAQAEALKEKLNEFLETKLRLKLSKEKTKISHINDGITFLGFRIKRCTGHRGMTTKIVIPKEAVRRVIGKIKIATDSTTHQDSVNSKILGLNRIIEGWCRYYQCSSKVSAQFGKVEYYTFWRLARWLGRKYRMSMPEVMRQYRKGNSFATRQYRLRQAGEFKRLRHRTRIFKPNPYTTQQVRISREELPQQTYWTGCEARTGMADLRPKVLERDKYACQICDREVKAETAEVDHIRPVRRYKRPVDANRLENLWTLCIKCHQEKTECDRQMESRMR